MEDETEICRVCRCGATPDQPLFHPCKCSGSIRHVHQDCLIEWLSHSRKKYCELCEHPFSFTPVYRADMPEQLPAILFVRQLYKKLTFLLCTVARAILVSWIWLIVLPYLTVWIWRFYFWSGENLSQQLYRLQQKFYRNTTSSGPADHGLDPTETLQLAVESLLPTTAEASRPTVTELAASAYPTLASGTDETHEPELSLPLSLFSLIRKHEWLQNMITGFSIRSFLSDCFEGQIITCVVVVVFVATFLLREWIVQNIPAELEADEEPAAEVEQIPISDDETEDERDHAGQQFRGHEVEVAGPDLLGHQHARDSHARQTLNAFNIAWNSDGESGDSDRHSRRSSCSSSEESQEQSEDDTTADNSGVGRAGPSEEGSRLNSLRQNDSTAQRVHVLMGQNELYDFNLDGGEQHRERPFEDRRNDGELAHEAAQQNRIAPPPPPAPANENAENEDNDMDEENIGDDIDGILEAIGMRGSLWMLAQNSALMCLLISLCLGAAVWIPYITGIVFLMSKPLDIVRVVFSIIHQFTDELLDALFLVCTKYLWPFAKHTYTFTTEYVVREHIVPLIPRQLLSSASYVYSEVQKYVHPQATFGSSNSSTFVSTADVSSTSTIWSALDDYKAWIHALQNIGPAFNVFMEKYHQIAIGTTSLDRFICIIIGYAAICGLGSLYLSRGRVPYASFGRSARQAIRQQGIILKVGMFIAIELLLFPLACGVLLDLSSLTLFRDASIVTRVQYLQEHPFASVFLHWFLGTAFMFLFAVLVTVCREIIRPGVMWFIRDPNDPQFHPIKEIVERPVLTQLRKIGASGIMYAIVIVAGVGGIVWCLQITGRSILPLHWNVTQPLSTIPIDFLMVHVAVPILVAIFEPKKTTKRFAVRWMRFLCRKLRLTSYMFGSRHTEEEGTWQYKTWRAWLQGPRQPARSSMNNLSADAIFKPDGQLVRAPKHDSVPFVPGRRMLVPVDPDTLEILDPEERRLGHPASSAAGGDMANTTIVYIPPRFKLRIALFLFYMWATFSIFVCALTVVPIALGRSIYKHWAPGRAEVHDIYTFAAGGSLLLLLSVTVRKLFDVGNELRMQPTVNAQFLRLRRICGDASFELAKVLYILATFGIAIPFAFGLITELYIVLPLTKLGPRPVVIEVLPVWARGFACMSILHGILNYIPNNRWRGYFAEITRRGYQDMDMRYITSKIVMPVMAVSLAAVILPFIAAYSIIQVSAERDPAVQIKLFQIMYPAALVGLGSYYLCQLGARLGQSWVQHIREDNYLVGRVLHNFED